MGFFSSLRKWFTDKTRFIGSRQSVKRKLDTCETVNNKRARMDDSLVEVVEISDESLSEAEEVEITEPGPSTLPLRASPPVMLIDGRHHKRRTVSPIRTVDLTGVSDDEKEIQFISSHSLSNPQIVSNRTSNIVRSAITSSKSCLNEARKLEDKYSQKSSNKSTRKSNLSMEGGISSLKIGSNGSINSINDNSFAMILKNYVLPKSDDSKAQLSVTSCKSLSDIYNGHVLNQSNLSKSSSQQNLDDVKLPTINCDASLNSCKEYVLNQSNLSWTSGKENIDIPELSLHKNRIIKHEMFYERILRRFKEKQAATSLDPISIVQKSPEDIFQEKLENMKKELEKLKPLKKQEVFPQYSQEIVNLISCKMSGPPSDYVVPNKNIRKSDLLTVYGAHTWLNDEVINHYMTMIEERDPKSIHQFATFFYVQLSSQGYQSVRRWSKKKDIFSFKKMFAPIHMSGNHWCLICVNFIEKSITYYDSLGGKNPRCLNLIFDYLKQEHKNKKNEELDIEGWRLLDAVDCPKQRNSYDCGVFTCIIAEYLARDMVLDFTQDDMPKLRKRICYEIINNKLCY